MLLLPIFATIAYGSNFFLNNFGRAINSGNI